MARKTLHDRTLSFLKCFVDRVWKKIKDKIFGYIASGVILGVVAVGAFIFGKNSQAVSATWTANKFGAICLHNQIREASESNKTLVADQPELQHAFSCAGKMSNMSGEPKHVLGRIKANFPRCFEFDPDNNLSFRLNTSNDKVRLWTNSSGKTLASCNCAEGQEELMAQHNTLVCGFDTDGFQKL